MFHFCVKQTTSVGSNGNLCRILSFNLFLAVMTIYFLFPIFEHFFNNKQKHFNFLWRYYCLKSVCIASFFGPCYPAVGLNTEIYGVFLRIQSGYGKMWTRKNSDYGHFTQCTIGKLFLNGRESLDFIDWHSYYMHLCAETC